MRQIEFLKNLEQLRFTGQLVQTATTGEAWTIYFLQGRIAYATGGHHAIRRWRRHLMTYCPSIPTYRLAWQIDLAKIIDEELEAGWEYALLKYWITQQRITQKQANQLIRSAVAEVLFDIIQAADVTDQLYRSPLSSLIFELLPVAEMVAVTETTWQTWLTSGLAAYSPNQAPVINSLDRIRWL